MAGLTCVKPWLNLLWRQVLLTGPKVLCGNYEEVALIGRVGAPAIALMNQNFKVRLRVSPRSGHESPGPFGAQ